MSLAALVRRLCLRAGLAETLIDVSGLWGAVEGYVITAVESPRGSISMLAQHFGFDAVESEGRIRFIMRGQGVVATITPDDMVAASGSGDVMELTRAQETELPQALKWQLARADEDYDAAIVEAQRITVTAARIASRSPGDLTIHWIRRSRALAADSWEAAKVPLAEDSEAYAVEILDGVAVKRTLTASTTSALYTAAQQVGDWGVPLGPGSSLAIRIY